MSLSKSLKLVWYQYRFERRIFWRNPSAAFFNFLFPLLFLALFGAIFSNDQNELNILVPGIAGMSVMSATFTSFAYQLTFLREQGILKRMYGTPLPRRVYVGGLTLSAVTNTVIQVTIIVVAGATLFGVDWPQDWAELVLFIFVGVICFASLGMALSYAIPNFDSAPAYVNAIFLPVIFVSGVFFDSQHAPQFLTDIANVLPLKHLIEGLSGGMVTGVGLSDNLDSLAVIGVWMIFGLFVAIRGFRWEARGK